ncbi:MAG: FAD-dependent oxidoreductase [Verrucomicrobiota bacterium]|nr:FAD-dependent oxidoreductase [Verrucomicrobiota bacterium]
MFPRLFASSVLILASLVALRAAEPEATSPKVFTADVCVYGATPGGILAAVAVRREGRSVVLVEPSRWVGGMLGAGLKPMQDCPNIAATGGMTRELLKTLGAPEWDENGRLVRASLAQSNLVAIRDDFLKLLREREIPVHYEHRIARCEKDGALIRGAIFDLAPFDSLGCPVAEPTARASLRVDAKIFIDASYEGDLFAAARCLLPRRARGCR